MQIAPEILSILDRCAVAGSIVKLPAGQLDRKTYEAVNKCLENIGGKWNRKFKGHVFEDDPRDLLDTLLATSETVDVRKQLQYFPTPRSIARRIVSDAEIIPSDDVLEPSAGKGNIAHAITDSLGRNFAFKLIELHLPFCQYLAELGYQAECGDFLNHYGTYDKIVMNPPFTRQQDIEHITHAFSLLKPGGVLVSIASEGGFFRSNDRSVAFRALVDKHGESEKLHADAFKESGTGVNTRIVTLRKAA